MTDRIFRTRAAVACGELLAEHPNGGAYQRCLPTIQGPVPGWATRALWEHYYEEATPPSAQLVLLRDATVRGPGVITLPGDIIVQESLINSHHMEAIAGLRRLAPDRYEAEPGFTVGVPAPPGRHVLLKQLWDVNYGHWLIEGQPRIALLAGVADPESCRFVVSSLDGMAAASAPMRAIVTESLSLCGITPAQIEVSGWWPQHFTELLYPLPLTVQPWLKAPCAIRMLEGLAGRLRDRSGLRGPQRLFVRRPAGGHRTLRNQDEIGALLTARGYATVTPGEMSFTQQVLAFCDASHVVGTLGAECANLAFAPAGARFFGLAPSDMLDDFFWDLISHKDGAYFALHGTAENSADGMNAAFSVDLATFTEMLDRFEA